MKEERYSAFNATDFLNFLQVSILQSWTVVDLRNGEVIYLAYGLNSLLLILTTFDSKVFFM